MNIALPILACCSLAIACSVLSIIVVLRRWAFVGEGIGHSAFGGAGVAWLLALLFPAMDQRWLPYLMVIVFGLLASVLIGRLSRGRPIGMDAAVGIFLVASVAFGFLAQQIYFQQRGVLPPDFEALLFGRMGEITTAFALSAGAVSLLVLVVLFALWKEILAYSFDPLIARTSGIRSGLIHDLLMILIALVIVIGVRIVGSVLIVALLVLPGATALLLSRNLRAVIAISLVTSLAGAVGGLGASLHWRIIPTGPAIVLAMFVLFLVALIVGYVRRTTT